MNIGIMGCGAIGSGIAKAIHQGLHPDATLTAVYDVDPDKVSQTCQLCDDQAIAAASLDELISRSDLIAEAVNADDTDALLMQILRHNKHLLVMSIGKLLLHPEILQEAKDRQLNVLIPSGAIAGIDALKAATVVGINEITITTYKPPQGLTGAPFITAQNISLEDIDSETTVFEGNVDDAVKAFPQNINVAATLALATNTIDKLRIRIITSPDFTSNRHKVVAKGSFGEITTTTRNTPSPDNPKTSYLAILSGLATLRSYFEKIKIGT